MTPGREVVATREPGATEAGAGDPGAGPRRRRDLDPRAEALLIAADRAEHVAEVIRPALARGAVVVSDRYVPSSLAYQGVARGLGVDEIARLSEWATGGLEPDLVIVLDVARRRGGTAPGGPAGPDGTGARLLPGRGQRRPTGTSPPVSAGRVIDGSAPVDVVADQIWEAVRPLI